MHSSKSYTPHRRRGPYGCGQPTDRTVSRCSGPEDGYPIVLAHGISCVLVERVWHEQINDLARDFRVIAYDIAGHGRSGVLHRSAYSLDHLAGDLDSVSMPPSAGSAR